MKYINLLIIFLILISFGIYYFYYSKKIEHFEDILINDNKIIIDRIMNGNLSNDNISKLIKDKKLKLEDVDKIVKIISERI